MEATLQGAVAAPCVVAADVGDLADIDPDSWVVAMTASSAHVIQAGTAQRLAASGVPWHDLPWEPAIAVSPHTPVTDAPFRADAPYFVLQDDDGTVSGVITAADAARLLQTTYRRLAAQHQTVLEAAHDAIAIIDRDYRVLGWNRAAERLFGTEDDEIIGRTIDRFFERDRLLCARVLKDGSAVRFQRHVPKDGVHTIISSLPVIVDGEIVGAISIEQDITHLVQQHMPSQAGSAALPIAVPAASRRTDETVDPYRHLVGSDAYRDDLIRQIGRAAETRATILVHGESGVGKELVARAIHEASPRANGPFVAINCGALPANLFESELFGYEPGAFTGADRRGKPGLLEQADGGTLFLDEVGELPLESQVKLLRVLEGHSFYRIGGTRPRQCNVRFVAATHRNLPDMIANGRFRQDLYYRLRVVAVNLKPLRERHDDLPVLFGAFLKEFAASYEREIRVIDPHILPLLQRYDWPGNVRELRNVVEHLVVMAVDGVVCAADLPAEVRQVGEARDEPSPLLPRNMPANTRPDRDQVVQALAATGGNRSAAARLLGVSRPTLYSYLKRFGLSP